MDTGRILQAGQVMLPPRIDPRAGFVSLKDLPRGANGYPLCRWCQRETPGPRRTFCGEACVHEWRIRTDPGYVRQKLHEKERGACQLCGVACGGIRGAWQADHIVPVAEGGGGCGLDGYRTLCKPCHKEQTKQLMQRLRREHAR